VKIVKENMRQNEVKRKEFDMKTEENEVSSQEKSLYKD
jgi:hypothetical protein